MADYTNYVSKIKETLELTLYFTDQQPLTVDVIAGGLYEITHVELKEGIGVLNKSVGIVRNFDITIARTPGGPRYTKIHLDCSTQYNSEFKIINVSDIRNITQVITPTPTEPTTPEEPIPTEPVTPEEPTTEIEYPTIEE